MGQLSGLPLQQLDLSCCRKLTDAGLALLSGLPLRRLELRSCRLTDAGLAKFLADWEKVPK